MASKFFLRTVIRNVPQWRSNDFAPYRNILEPYHRTWDYFTGERSRPPLWDISSGCILWLPSKSKVRPETLKGSGFENENEDAFDRPILCVDVEIKSPTNGIIYFVKMGSFSETGGPAQYIQQVDSRVSQWVHRPWAETILPIVRRDSIHNYKRVLYLGEDSKRTENVRSTEESTVQAGCGIFAIPFTEVRCYNNQSGFDVGYKSGKWRDGWCYRLDEPSFEIVREIIGLKKRPWLKSGTKMWDHFIAQTGIATQKQLKEIEKSRIIAMRNKDFLERQSSPTFPRVDTQPPASQIEP